MTNEELVAALNGGQPSDLGWSEYVPREGVRQEGFAGARRVVGLWTFEIYVSKLGPVYARVYRVIDQSKELLPPFGARAAEQAKQDGASIEVKEVLGTWALELEPGAVVAEKVRSAVAAVVEKAIAEQQCCLDVLRDVRDLYL